MKKTKVVKAEPIRTKEKSQEIADKITPIFEVIEQLTEEDIEYLKDTAIKQMSLKLIEIEERKEFIKKLEEILEARKELN